MRSWWHWLSLTVQLTKTLSGPFDFNITNVKDVVIYLRLTLIINPSSISNLIENLNGLCRTDQKNWQKASPPQKINSGTWIRTGPSASAALVLPNKTQTRIAKNSELLLKSKEKKSEVNEVENTNEVVNEDNIVKSPMVGVAYLSADPNSQPYVKVGQHVKAGDTLLLIEAMKTFNEIKAPRSGIIKKIVTLNSQPVEYGDTLIIFE